MDKIKVGAVAAVLVLLGIAAVVMNDGGQDVPDADNQTQNDTNVSLPVVNDTPTINDTPELNVTNETNETEVVNDTPVVNETPEPFNDTWDDRCEPKCRGFHNDTSGEWEYRCFVECPEDE